MDLKMSELREGMIVVAHGMELLLTEGYTRDYSEDTDYCGHPSRMVYGFVGVIQNLEEVEAEGSVPRSYRQRNRWTIQGNDYVSYKVIG